MQQTAPAEIDLSGWADEINAALEHGLPCQLISQDPDSYPDIAYKGSFMVFDNDHLAWWERSLNEQIAQVEKNPRVTFHYRNPETRLQLRIYGTAEIHKTGPVRDAIMAKVVQRELDADPERKGYGVMMRVDRVRRGRDTIQLRPGIRS